jgi:hypothetical protein
MSDIYFIYGLRFLVGFRFRRNEKPITLKLLALWLLHFVFCA